MIDIVARSSYHDNSQTSKKYSYTSKNYLCKNTITKTQWRRHQRKKKAAFKVKSSIKNDNVKAIQEGQSIKKLAKQRLFPPLSPLVKSKEEKAMPNKDEDMASKSFDSGSGEELAIIFYMIFVLPVEYYQVTKVTEDESGLAEEMAIHKLLRYYMMNKIAIYEDNTVFERPNYRMKQHLKPLFIWVKVENMGINKVLVDRGPMINIIQHLISRNIGKFDTILRSHNTVLSNYKWKT